MGAMKCANVAHLRKTKLCAYYVTDSCQYGDRCAFAHTDTELHSVPDFTKTRLCQAYEQGECDKKDCGFAHGEEELRSTSLSYKKTLCIWNQKGKCRNGDKCRFAHGSAELQGKQGESGGRGSHDTTSTSGKQATAKDGKAATALKEPMKVITASCLSDALPAGLPATVPVEAPELDEALPEGLPPCGPPFPPEVYGGLDDSGGSGLSPWWQWSSTYGMWPHPYDAGMPGAGVEDLKADLERLRRSILDKDTVPNREHLGDDIESLTQKCDAIQMQMEVMSQNMYRAAPKDADPIFMDSYVCGAPGQFMDFGISA